MSGEQHQTYISCLRLAERLTPVPLDSAEDRLIAARERWQQGLAASPVVDDCEEVEDEDILDPDATLPGVDVELMQELLRQCR